MVIDFSKPLNNRNIVKAENHYEILCLNYCLKQNNSADKSITIHLQ